MPPDAVKVFGYLLCRDADRIPIDPDPADFLGFTAARFQAAVEALSRLKAVRLVYQHRCGAIFDAAPNDPCPECNKTTIDTDGRLPSLRCAIQIMAQGPEATSAVTRPKPIVARKAPAPDRTMITDAVQRLAILTGVPKTMLNAAFWSAWGAEIRKMLKRIEDTGYTIDDIPRALDCFYNANYSFEAPRFMTPDLTGALTNKLAPRSKRDNRRPIIPMNAIPSDAVSRTEEGVRPDDGVRLEGRYG